MYEHFKAVLKKKFKLKKGNVFPCQQDRVWTLPEIKWTLKITLKYPKINNLKNIL